MTPNRELSQFLQKFKSLFTLTCHQSIKMFKNHLGLCICFGLIVNWCWFRILAPILIDFQIISWFWYDFYEFCTDFEFFVPNHDFSYRFLINFMFFGKSQNQWEKSEIGTINQESVRKIKNQCKIHENRTKISSWLGNQSKLLPKT